MIAEKKAANQKEWNAMTALVSLKQQRPSSMALLQEYLKKKAEA
jgi:hypothetical protein